MWISASIAIFFIVIGESRADDVQRYDGWSVIRVHPETEDHMKCLNLLGENETNSEIQIWQHGSLHRPFDLFLSPQAKPSILANLDSMNITYTINTEDIQTLLDAENEHANATGRHRASSSAFTRFLKWDEILAMLKELANQYPNLIQLGSIGTTHEGRPIVMVKVSSNDANYNKPAIWIDGGIHAREWIATSTTLYMLNKLVTGYGTNRALTNFVDGATWYFVPVVNPDGYVYTRTDRMWRKNRRPAACSTRYCCRGVDLNRNFDYDFHGVGGSTSSCRETYHGPGAFSEPEAQAVRDFLLSHKEIQAYITLHSYSQMWFYPFGDHRHSFPENVEELASLARQGATALASVRGTKYEVGTAADLLYPSGGGSDDWAKGKAGIRYVYCLELVPTDDAAGNGFIVSPRQIIPTGEETWTGLSVIFQAVISSMYS